jgi:hypothetical protein
MRKKYIYTFLFFLLTLPVLSQTFGNEWINYSQKYYRIFVLKSGIYRIDSLTLANAGVPLNTVNPKNIQIFGRGKEEYIYIKGESDGVFNSTDTLEFYGRGNDGFLDSTLYNGATPPNPYVSLFNDTSIYYLTWNQSQTNRRMVSANDTLFTAYTPNTFVFKEDINASASDYFQGTTDLSEITDPEYLPMEGVVNTATSFDAANYPPYTASLHTANIFAGGPAAVISLCVLTRSNDNNVNPDTHIQIAYPGFTFDTLVDGYMTFRRTVSVPLSSLTAASPVTLSSINPGASMNSGDAAFSFVYIKYPHTLDMEGGTEFKMIVPAHLIPSKSYLNLTNFNSQGSTVRFYDLTFHRRIRVVPNGSTLQLLVGDSLSTDKTCYLTSDNMETRVLKLSPVNGTGSFTNFRQMATDSAYLIVTNAMLWSSANAYKLYRSSVQGGSHHVIMADIDELYDQFAYGVRMHPYSVRRFCNYLWTVYPNKPAYLFLIGKSLNPYLQRFLPVSGMLQLPTMGYPASDNLFTIKFGNASYVPALATGRIAAQTNSDVLTYLNKVSAYEQNAAAPWMKQVLHFGGGSTSGEQNLFRTYLYKYQRIIEADTNYGGHVTSFFKTSTAPIQINQSDSLKLLVDNGVSIITFFGHASGSGFDVSIDDPSNYHNAPRFPLILANSCLAGDIHSSSALSTSVKFINGPTGAIGFIASTTLGLPAELDPYSTGLYRSIAKYNYGRSIGRHIQYTIRKRETASPMTLYARETVLCMTLNGDPAVVVASPRLPDYAITASDVSFDTHSQPDSVTVTARMHNYGKAIIDSFFVHIQRRYATGDTDTYKKMVRAPAFLDSFKIKIPVDFNRGIGLNKVAIILDFTNRIQEMTKVNNSTGDVDLLIQGSSILPVWPYNDAIYPYDTLTLKASTANPFEPPRNYRIQFDTTDTYNSPFTKTAILVNKAGGVVAWKPPVAHLTDSIVYYWRISPDTVGTNNHIRWKESSFQYITNKRGWEQAHFFQFKNDQYQFVKFNRSQRKFNFVNDVKSIEVNNAVMGIGGHDWPDVNYKINGVTLEESSNALTGFSFAVLNPRSIKPWSIDTACTAAFVPYVDPHIGNTVSFCGQVMNAYDFADTSVACQNRMANFLSSVPVGYYLIAWTNSFTNGWGGSGPGFDTVNSYSNVLKQQFASFGSGMITPASTTVNDKSAYIMVGRKGWLPGHAKEMVSPDQLTKITLTDTLTTNWPNGFIASEIIGPAKSWSEFHVRKTHLETPTYDSLVIRVIGISATGVQTTLLNLKDTTRDMYNLGNYVNATAYPYIRLIAYMQDDSALTPPQLKRWQVIYSQAPEMAVNPAVNFTIKKDTVQEGQSLVMTCAIQNISDLNFTDSLQISYWLLDKNHARHNLILPNNKSYKVRKPPFNANTYFIDTVTVNTSGYPGLNSLWMETNPLSTPRTEKEQYHFNNLIEKPFLVTSDKINPLLDVTFDGIHILDGDIVSAKPNILVSLKDENMFLALNDTADFKLFIQFPNSSVLQPVYFRNQIAFTPAILPRNSCRLVYSPVLTGDGVYTLTIQAKDRSNNSSGKINYQINFDVINHATITDVMNYPNPFSTATHFVFTITGSEVPTTFRIQIMTITGKLVREIEREELGSLHIGRNITDYAWDGRDQFGDRLANGVYFYRVLTRLNSDNIDHMDSGADQYIKKGFGKMYLMK